MGKLIKRGNIQRRYVNNSKYYFYIHLIAIFIFILVFTYIILPAQSARRNDFLV